MAIGIWVLEFFLGEGKGQVLKPPVGFFAGRNGRILEWFAKKTRKDVVQTILQKRCWELID